MEVRPAAPLAVAPTHVAQVSDGSSTAAPRALDNFEPNTRIGGALVLDGATNVIANPATMTAAVIEVIANPATITATLHPGSNRRSRSCQ